MSKEGKDRGKSYQRVCKHMTLTFPFTNKKGTIIIIVLVSECRALWGERSLIRDLQTKCEDGSDVAQSNKTGHAALSACVGALTFSCKDVASPNSLR